MEMSSNISEVKKIKVVPKQTKKNMAQKRTTINIIDSTSTCPPCKSVILPNRPIQWLNTQNENIDQSSNINIQNVMSFQNVSGPRNDSMPIPVNSVDANPYEEKDKKFIKFYTPGNFQYSSAGGPQINSSAENILSVNSSINSFNNYMQSNMLISSSVGQYDFYEIPTVIPENNQSHVNQHWNLCGPFTIVPNTLSSFSSAPNTVISSPTEVQTNRFGIFGKENQQIINSVNIPALQPFTCYTQTSNTPLLLSQDDIRNSEVLPTSSTDGNFLQNRDISCKVKPKSSTMCASEVLSTISGGGSVQNRDISCKVESIIPTVCVSEIPSTTSGGGFLQNRDIGCNPTICASSKNILLQFPNTSVKLNEERVQKEFSNPKRVKAVREIAKKSPNQEQTLNLPLNNERKLLLESSQAREMTTNALMNSQRLVQEEHSYSTMALDFFEDLRNTQSMTNTDQPENRKRKFNVPVENMADYNCLKNVRKLSNENETVTTSILARATPIVNDNKLDDEFINCLYGEFDINDKGDIEFPNQNMLGSLKDCSEASQCCHEFQMKRECEESKNKVGVVLKKKKRGYESSLL